MGSRGRSSCDRRNYRLCTRSTGGTGDLPAVGTTVNQGDEAAVIESVKAAGDVKSPVTGTIVEVNESLNDSPESVNNDATGQGWFYKIEIADTSELENLLSETTYNALIAEPS